ncbi:hypothetical protein HZI73_11250 [Vallitalea pronyensis]|uniref:Nascent polypeptide-associated complex subunit alpha-like UBA domain-containing protein n=1 Tax=Vallitalea pronyensis TaxID=1348613 RepID=A0A8J8MJI5_9FIRM|nr:hypothetical protein [Vallitalea pronyensis]QUI22830.1 hypothetical protein HZI73_11250 [Vallitalea pronyensis]
MVIKDSDIEIILQRVNVSYAEAEKALIKSKGDINRAIRYLEKKENSFFKKVITNINKLILNLVYYQLVLTRKGETLINLPIILIVFFFIVFEDLKYVEMIILLLIIILTDCKVSIHKKDKAENPIKEEVIKPKTKSKQNDDITTTLEVIEEDDYNEIFVEN